MWGSVLECGVDVGNCWGRCREVCAGGVGKCVGVGGEM